MAGQEFPSSIDRCLLTSAAAALTATCIGPGVERRRRWATPEFLDSPPHWPNNKAEPHQVPVLQRLKRRLHLPSPEAKMI